MPKEYSRTRRVGELIQRELADIIRREIADSSLGMITVSAVDVSPDLHNAKVYITALGSRLEPAAIVAHLAQAAGLLRHALAHQVRMRTVPRLHFTYDTSVEYGQRLSSLIDAAVAADTAHRPADEDGDEK